MVMPFPAGFLFHSSIQSHSEQERPQNAKQRAPLRICKRAFRSDIKQRVSVRMIVSKLRHDIVSTRRVCRVAALAAFAVGLATLPASNARSAISNAVQASTSHDTTEMSSRRKVRRVAHERRKVRRVRHARSRHARGVARSAEYRGGREASISQELRSLIADLRSKHGADSVRVISGRDSRGYSKSCHPLGQAFDAHVSRTAMADLRSRHFGLITYSGGMHHVHVSSCAREAGLRAHKSVGGRNIFARYMGRMKRGG